MTQPETTSESKLIWRWAGRVSRPVVGWVLVAAGIIAIVAGWFGVSGEALVAKQLPYLISGGVLGLGLIIFGSMFLGTEEVRRDTARLDALERLVAELHGVLLSRPDAPRLDSTAVAQRRNGRRGRGRAAGAPTGLVALRGGQTFHLAGCRMVRDKSDVEEVDTATVRLRGLSPCRLCEPEPVPA